MSIKHTKESNNNHKRITKKLTFHMLRELLATLRSALVKWLLPLPLPPLSMEVTLCTSTNKSESGIKIFYVWDNSNIMQQKQLFQAVLFSYCIATTPKHVTIKDTGNNKKQTSTTIFTHLTSELALLSSPRLCVGFNVSLLYWLSGSKRGVFRASWARRL